MSSRVEGGWRVYPGTRAGPGPPPGETVMFRPEDPRIARPGEGNIPGVSGSFFCPGDHGRLAVEIGADAPLVVKTVERHAFAPGRPIGLHPDPASILTPRR